jgi:hypothetical protein
MVDDFFGSYSGGDVAPEFGENVFDPTFGGQFGEVGGENVFDPTFGGQFGEVDGENVFDPTYGGTLPPVMGGGDESVFDPKFSSTLTPAQAAKLINADTTGLLRKLFVDDKGNLNLKTLAGIGGGLLGGLGALSPDRPKSGYQGSIPKYDAVRNMVTAPPTRAQGYRPGQGGINYGGDVSFVPKGTAASTTATQPSQAINRAPADMSGIMAGLAGMGGQMPQGGLPRAMPQPRPANAQPISKDDPFYQSPEYKAFQNDPSNMMGTDDMYDSPYFGRMSSGSTGSAMDRAYEKYKGIAPQQNQQIPAMFNQFNSAPIENQFAQGGLTNLASGRYLQGKTDGMADKIPARIGRDQPAALSHGEFVVPADVVSHLGNGNSDAGAKKLYQMMDKIRTARTGTKKQGKQINPDKFMPGGLAQAYANGGSVQRFNTGGTAGTTGLGSAASAGVTGSETAPNKFAGEYIADMLGKGQALANAPYQQYMGPLTAGESGLQSKVFGGLQNMNFPGNLGASFSSTGAYQPPQMNMGAYQQMPIGVGTQRPTYDQYTASLPAGQQPVAQNIYDAGLAGSSVYGQPGQMPQGGLAGLLGGGDQGKQMQPMPGQPGYEQYLANIKQGEIEAEERRKSRLTSGGELERMQAMQEYGYGQKPYEGLAGFMQQQSQQPQQPQGIASQYMNPYLQSVLTPQLEELRRQNEITNMASNAKATGMGAFGGGRQAIMNAENNRNLMQEMNKTVGAGYSNAFDKAMGQFNTEQARDLGLAKFMSDQGAQQRGIEAEGIAADKAAFEAARENPYKMLQYQQSLLQGMPISATNIDMATPTKIQEILSGIGGGVKMVGNKPEDISLKSVTDLLDKLGLKTGG